MSPKALLLAAALTAPLQNDPSGSYGSKGAVESKAMQEDLETMRLVLARKLAPLVPQEGKHPAWVYHDTTQTPPAPATGSAHQVLASAMGSYLAYPGIQQQGRSAGVSVEAVHVSHAGVVFTVTMAGANRTMPIKTAEPVKPETVTDWDRARSALEGKQAPVTSPAPRREPPVAEVLLKTLADNARHFRELRDDERITVAVVFRRSGDEGRYWAGGTQSLRGLAFAENLGDGVTAPTGSAGYPAPSTGEPRGSQAGARTASGPSGVNPMTPDTYPATITMMPDDDAVAELHVKRGNYAEAIKMFTEAVNVKGANANKLSGDPAKAAALANAMQQLRSAYAKLAQAQMAAGRFDEAKATMEAARNAEANMKSPRPQAQLAPPPLPHRLTISGLKRDFVAAGSGKLSFDDLVKAVTITQSQGPVKK